MKKNQEQGLLRSEEVRMLEKLEHSRFTREAEEKIKNPEAIHQIEKLALFLSQKIKKGGNLVQGLFEYLSGGKDKGLKLIALAALIYFVSPVDFIPDFIPVVGFGDDLSLMSLVMVLIAKLVSNSSEDTKDKEKVEKKEVMKKTVENPIHGFWNGIFHRIHSDMKDAAEEQVWVRVKGQLLVVIISLAGMIAAGVLIFVLRKFFFS